MKEFVAQLQRRRVFRVAVLYLAVAFAVLQGADLVLPSMPVPPWTFTLLVVLTVFGFPISVVLAWAYDITPAGIKRADADTAVDAAPAAATGLARPEPAAPVPDAGASPAVTGPSATTIHARAEDGEDADEPRRTHLMIMPFRSLRPDPDTDFLCFSLPDAVSCSLSGLRSLVVRSRLAADQSPEASLDLNRLARELGIDAVLTGTLMRVGDRIRVNAQVARAPGGEMLWSQIADIDFGDLFTLQDEISHRILESLSVALSKREKRALRQDVPASAGVYETYLRANQLVQQVRELGAARDLYLRCIHEDPNYASAWARLGHCYRLIGKWSTDQKTYRTMLEQAEIAFRKAFDLNPHLPLAHNLYTPLEVERGRALEASTRLLERARAVGGDPNLFAGLVHVSRFSGLLEVSVAAHVRARRLDPSVRTSVGHSYFMLGRYDEALKESTGDIGYLGPLSLAALGRLDEARRVVTANEPKAVETTAHAHIVSLKALLEGDREIALEAAATALRDPRDPEAHFYAARHFAYLREVERALDEFERLGEMGYCCAGQLQADPWLASVRESPRFESILARAETALHEAHAAFASAGGHAVLGPIPVAA